MVRFFNQKEEVIKIEITPFGKEQFSKGIFSPAFYAFYDGSVIYDGEYANITETQNQITNRITNETPNFHIKNVDFVLVFILIFFCNNIYTVN